MSKLYRQMKRKVKQVTPIESMSVGIDYRRDTVRVTFFDHYVELSEEDINFLVKLLPEAQADLKRRIAAKRDANVSIFDNELLLLYLYHLVHKN